MMKKKILWMTNVRFSLTEIKSTGTWLQPLAEGLSNNEIFEIHHISMGNVEDLHYELVGNISQYIIPFSIRKEKKKNDIIVSLIDRLNPDLIHIWGTESHWFPMNKLGVFANYKVLLDIQGLLKSCYESFYGGLNLLEQIKCLGINDVLRPSSSMWYVRYMFKKKAIEEERGLRTFKNISYQSEWVKNRLSELNLDSKFYGTKIILRDEFYNHRWRPTDNASPILFTIMSSLIPYKGLHVLIKACSIVKNKYPKFILNVVGNVLNGKSRTGYEIYIEKLLYKFDIASNVRFCGPLTSIDIIDLQLKSDVSVVPSFVESYCLGMAEAMMVGLPTVAAYSAALPSIADDKVETLFYSPLDYVDCAAKIIKVFEEKKLALTLSENAINRRIKDNSVENVISTQIGIYNDIFDSQ